MVKRLVALLALFTLLLASFPMAVLADYDYLYENRMVGEDANAEVHGANWFGQVFTGDGYHSVTEVRLKLYREGNPGTLTLSLRDADTNEPVGGEDYYVDYSSGTYNGDTVTDNAAGEWITFELSPEIDIGHGLDYALVLRAEAGDAANSIHWLYDSTSAAGDDNYASSNDSGGTWASNTNFDFLFSVWGFESLEIQDVAIFSSVYEDGDWLICTYFRATPSPFYPGTTPSAFSLVLVEPVGDEEIAKIPLFQWGYKPTAIYLSQSQVATLATEYGFTWGDPGYMYIVDTDETIYSISFFLWPQYWAGADLFLIDEWIRATALDMEDYYGDGLCYTESIDTGTDEITFPEDEGILTPTGGDIFMDGIYGIEQLRPELFYYVYHELDDDPLTSDPDYEEAVGWETQVGPYVATFLSSGGDLLNIEGNTFGGGIILLVYVGFVGLISAKLRSSNHSFQTSGAVATGLAIPVVLSGLFLRLVSWPLVAIICTALLLLFFWFLWLSRT